eukprot:12177249-Alexandrium_andersonii.AAC.1
MRRLCTASWTASLPSSQKPWNSTVEKQSPSKHAQRATPTRSPSTRPQPLGTQPKSARHARAPHTERACRARACANYTLLCVCRAGCAPRPK